MPDREPDIVDARIDPVTYLAHLRARFWDERHRTDRKDRQRLTVSNKELQELIDVADSYLPSFRPNDIGHWGFNLVVSVLDRAIRDRHHLSAIDVITAAHYGMWEARQQERVEGRTRFSTQRTKVMDVLDRLAIELFERDIRNQVRLPMWQRRLYALGAPDLFNMPER